MSKKLSILIVVVCFLLQSNYLSAQNKREYELRDKITDLKEKVVNLVAENKRLKKVMKKERDKHRHQASQIKRLKALCKENGIDPDSIYPEKEDTIGLKTRRKAAYRLFKNLYVKYGKGVFLVEDTFITAPNLKKPSIELRNSSAGSFGKAVVEIMQVLSDSELIVKYKRNWYYVNNVKTKGLTDGVVAPITVVISSDTYTYTAASGALKTIKVMEPVDSARVTKQQFLDYLNTVKDLPTELKAFKAHKGYLKELPEFYR